MRVKQLGKPSLRQRQLAFVIRSVLNPLTLTAGITGMSLLPVAALTHGYSHRRFLISGTKSTAAR